jgi:hypothetical protein
MAISIDDNKKQYLVRYDKSPYALFGSEADAVKAISSIADYEERELRKPSVETFRRTLQEGKEIHILTKSKGVLYDSGLVVTIILDILPVPRLYTDYSDRIAQYKAEKGK